MDSSSSRWQTMQQQLGQSLAAKLYADLSRHTIRPDGPRRPPVSTSLALAYVAATAVWTVSVILALLGLRLLLEPWNNFFVVISGAMLVALAWLCIPRRAPAPDDVLARHEFPTLYGLADRLAIALGAPPIDGIAVSTSFGANYRISGWRGRRFIELGMPLLATLTSGERIAVLAHELSHGANGDPLRGQYLFGAVDAIAKWASAIRPLSIGSAGDRVAFGPIVSLMAIPLELVMLASSELLLLFARAILLLVLRDSQRSEYLADLLAASVSGSAHMQSALEKTYLADQIEAVIRTHALTGAKDALLPKLTAAANALPASAAAQLRERSRQSSWQVDTTHPPTALRIDMLSAQSASAAALTLQDHETLALNAELARLAPAIERELVNHYLVGIYG